MRQIRQLLVSCKAMQTGRNTDAGRFAEFFSLEILQLGALHQPLFDVPPPGTAAAHLVQPGLNADRFCNTPSLTVLAPGVVPRPPFQVRLPGKRAPHLVQTAVNWHLTPTTSLSFSVYR